MKPLFAQARDNNGRFVKGHAFLGKKDYFAIWRNNGGTPWNKGKEIQTNTGRTHFKTGNTPHNLGKSYFCKDLAGSKVGRLTVISHQAGVSKRSSWLCQCDCGNTVVVRSDKLKLTRSCGCLQREYARQKGRVNSGSFYVGYRHKPETIEKLKQRTEEKNHRWRGDDVGYIGLHIWVAKTLGKPGTCEHCGKSGLKGSQIHWANKSWEYKRDKKDWLRLCAKCHQAYDKNHE